MRGLKRQISPGAATFFVVVVLSIVMWVWWRGLVYKVPSNNPMFPPPPSGNGTLALEVRGRDYVTVETYAGDLDPGDADGIGYMARFDRPTGISAGPGGDVYVCDTGNHRLRKINASGFVTTVAGTVQGMVDGPLASAKFNAPCGVCVAPDGAIYVADTGNARVRIIRGDTVSTVVQDPRLKAPVSIAYVGGAAPELLVADGVRGVLDTYDLGGHFKSETPHKGPLVVTGRDIATAAGKAEANETVIPIEGAEQEQDLTKRPAIHRLTGWCKLGPWEMFTDAAHAAVFYRRNGSAEVMAGVVSTAGPMRDYRDGNGEKCYFNEVTGVATDGVQYAYVCDTGNNCIRRLTFPSFLTH